MTDKKTSALTSVPGGVLFDSDVVHLTRGSPPVDYKAQVGLIRGLLAPPIGGLSIIFTPTGAPWAENQTTAGLLMGTLSVPGGAVWSFVGLDVGAVKYTLGGAQNKLVYSTVTPWDADSPGSNYMLIEATTGAIPDRAFTQFKQYVRVPLANDPADDEPTKLWDFDFVNNVGAGGVTLADFNVLSSDLTAGVGLKMNGLGSEYIMPYSMTPNSWGMAGVSTKTAVGTIGGFAAIDFDTAYGWLFNDGLRNMTAGEKMLFMVKIGRHTTGDGSNGWATYWTGSALNSSDQRACTNDVLGVANNGGLPTGVAILGYIPDVANNAQTIVFSVTAQNTGVIECQVKPYTGTGKWRGYGMQGKIVPDFLVWPVAWVSTANTIVTAAGTNLVTNGGVKALATAAAGTIAIEVAGMVRIYPAAMLSRGNTTGVETSMIKVNAALRASVHTYTGRLFCGTGGFQGVSNFVFGWDNAAGSGAGAWTLAWNGNPKGPAVLTGTGQIPAGTIAKLCAGLNGTLLRVSGYAGKLVDGQIFTRSRLDNRALPSASVGLHKGLGSALSLGYASPNPKNFDARNYASTNAMLRRRTLVSGEANYRDNSVWAGLFQGQRNARFQNGSEPFVDTFFYDPDCRGGCFNGQHEIDVMRESFEDLTGWAAADPLSIGADGELVITAKLYSALSSQIKANLPDLPTGGPPTHISKRLTMMDLYANPGDYTEFVGWMDRDGTEWPWPAYWGVYDIGGGAQLEMDWMEGLDANINKVFVTGHTNAYSLGDDQLAYVDTGVNQRTEMHSYGLSISRDGTKVTAYQDGAQIGATFNYSARNYTLAQRLLINLAMGGFMGTPAGLATRQMSVLRVSVWSIDSN